MDELAAKITDIHKTAYGTPTPFISVVFEDISKTNFYEGGVQTPGYNRIFAIVRIGGSRTSQDFNELCVKLSQAWREVVSEKDASTGSVQRKLAGAFVLRSINAMWEHGFVLPEPGQDEEWFKQNKTEFQERARAGDGTMMRLLKELGISLED
ncbi:hypothetical protein TRIATDRAFT_323088 [Trichoderma atroviride IMI 206040]|uniref:Tautomerase cis-CaaD-like domain-containing protein n=1 Tax=Hypocrea atroviridis (strain ATCC 20476 / IMI 206040) TaxID=452589 RepID=G9PCG5_HYPAI|nr:uncharacterized protein TRIATDRAFT_323088 [Trichoderma atroviride IMI 206040]EHK39539.1 hypothetical protein TRIATDRAFT_323088 [Trichoderma atroviride IMI 206040]